MKCTSLYQYCMAKQYCQNFQYLSKHFDDLFFIVNKWKLLLLKDSRPILNYVKFLSYLKHIFAGLGDKNVLNIVFGQIFGNSTHSVKASMMMKLAGLDDLGFAKGQIKSKLIYEVIDFHNTNSKIWRISALKVLKLSIS